MKVLFEVGFAMLMPVLKVFDFICFFDFESKYFYGCTDFVHYCGAVLSAGAFI